MFPGKISASPRRQALTYRQFFAARWAAFIEENFDSPAHAAAVFGVDGSTVQKWLKGNHAPSGFAVGYAYDHFPDEAAKHLREAS